MEAMIKMFTGILMIIIIFMVMTLLQNMINESNHKKKMYELEQERYKLETSEISKPSLVKSFIGYKPTTILKNNNEGFNLIDLSEEEEDE